MKRWHGSTVVAGLVLVAATMLLSAPPAFAECENGTQGELALLLAKKAGLVSEDASQQDAVQALVTKGVQPKDGWKAAECVTDDIINDLHDSVVALGLDQDLLNQLLQALEAAFPVDAPSNEGLGIAGGSPGSDRNRNPNTNDVTPISPVSPN